MLKVEGLVYGKDNKPDMGQFAALSDELDLDLEMPDEAVSHEQKLQVLVDNAQVIRDAVVGFAKTCGTVSGSYSGDDRAALGNRKPWSNWMYGRGR